MDPTVPPAPRLWTRHLWPALVAVLTAAAFARSLQGEFLIWDDDLNFLDNPAYRGLAPANLKWMFTTFLMGHWHPLTWMTLGLDYTIWGMNPVGYHLTSLLLHSANALLLYFVILAFLRLAGRPDLRWPAAIGALFYSLHPLRVESVAWITERRDVLCGFFTLLTVLAYLKRVEEERAGRSGLKWLALALTAFAASLLSKALSITLPAILLLIDVYPLGRFKTGSRRRVLLEKIPFALLSCADAAVMLVAMRHIEAVHEVAGYNLLARIAQAAYGLCFYVLKTLWPTQLLPIYPIEGRLDWTRAVYLAAIAAVVAVSALLLVLRRRRPEALVAWIAYAVLVSPVLGVAVTGMQIAADRYTYLAMIPASILLAAGLRSPKAGALAGAVLLVLGLLTVAQCGVWRDTISLWTREITHQPGLYLPYNNRATAKLQRGDLDGALTDFDQSIAINPAWQVSRAGRASLRGTRGDHAAALDDFNRAIQIDPRYAGAYAGRAISRQRTGDPRGALEDCAEALRLEPGLVVALMNRGLIRYEQNDFRGAISDYSDALKTSPQSPELHKNRGLAYYKAGKFPEAVADLSRALELRPNHVETLVNRALAYTLMGKPREAAADTSAALRLKDDPILWLRRANLRGMLGEVDGAIADASEALRLKPDFAEAHASRGFARMSRGDRAGAAEDFTRALELAPPNWPQRPQIEKFLQEARGPK